MERRKAIKYSLAGFAQIGLLGGVMTWSGGCVTPPQEDYHLKVLSDSEFKILEIISDIIIPPSDTPGAADVGVAEAIDQFLYGFMVPQNQLQIKRGLNTVNAVCHQLFQKDIKIANETERHGVVEYLSKDAIKSPNKDTHFFYVVRGLIVSAYFQSEVVAKTVLRYDPIPGELNGAFPISKTESSWTFTV